MSVSKVASNATTTTMMVPVVLTLSDSLNVNPLYLALGHVTSYNLSAFSRIVIIKGVTLTASHAFMLPVSTPCNAIVFNAGKVRANGHYYGMVSL